MAMLAEPRRKQKWTLNPRGKQWSEDPNKFGQRMLEKMGWTMGKGLGASEQGITEHVRVSLKNDNSGIGFKKDTLDEAWTEHRDSYNEFLKQLRENENLNTVKAEENDVLSGKSLELKSKQSRARVHYQKFTRGKDVNKYTSKDLANIFGQKELSIIKNESVQEEKLNEIETQDNRGGVVTINGGNMTEYFMKKGRQITYATTKEQEENESESELTKCVGFGFSSEFQKEAKSFEEEEDAKQDGKKGENKKRRRQKEDPCSIYAFENPCIQLDSPEIISNSSEGRSSKRKSIDDIKPSPSKKIKKLKNEESVSEREYGIVNVALDLDSGTVNETINGKEFEVPREQFGLTNTGLDLSDETNVKKRRVTFNDHVEYSSDPIKKKKKVTTLDKFEVENTKKKKKKSKDKKRDDHVVNDNSISSGFVNEALELVEEPAEVNDNNIVIKKKKKSKDKKKLKSDDENCITSGFVNEALDLAAIETSTEVNDNEINEISEIRCDSASKKKRRRSNLETIIEIPEEDGPDVAKRTKVEDDIIEINDSAATTDSNRLQNGEIKKKKKKRKENINTEGTIVPKIEEKKIILEPGNLRLEEEDEQSINEEKKIMDILQEKKRKKKNKDSDQTEEKVQDDTETVKLKKKKKKKEKQDKDINQNCDIKPEIDGNKENDVHEELTEIELKEKKKKKKNREEDNLNVGKTNDLNKLEEETEIKRDSPNRKSRKEYEESNEIELSNESKENNLEIQYSQDNRGPTKNTKFPNNKNKNNRRSSTWRNSTNRNSNSPRNQRARMTKKLLISLFNRNSIYKFPGSNLDEIKGYGV